MRGQKYKLNRFRMFHRSFLSVPGFRLATHLGKCSLVYLQWKILAFTIKLKLTAPVIAGVFVGNLQLQISGFFPSSTLRERFPISGLCTLDPITRQSRHKMTPSVWWHKYSAVKSENDQNNPYRIYFRWSLFFTTDLSRQFKGAPSC